MKKIIALLWACLLFAAGVKAQNTVDLQFAPTSFKQVGPSPQAAAMTRYADTPVSYGLGLAQVSIPLYEVKSRSLTLPVSLSYDSSGVRVDAVSGPVGLNWALVSGGAITRTVIGYPDEAYNGWNDSDPEYGYDLTQDNASTANTLKKISNGELDPGRDRYSYNFCGYSGSFYYVGGEVVPTTATDLVFSGATIGDESGFLITDPSGTKYYFTEKETSSSNTSMTLPIFGAGSGSPENYPASMVPVTAWYLTRIESMDGTDRINLTYETTQNPMISEIHSYVTSYSFTYKYESAGSFSWLGENGQWWSAAPAVSAQLGGYQTLRGWTPHLLSRIEWDGGKVTFTYENSPVNENSYVRRSYPKILTRMDVWSVPVGTSNSTLVRRAAFTQSSTSDKRTLLKTVSLTGSDETPIESYNLAYIGELTTNMDPRMKDLFGYYNGKISNNYTDFLRLFPNENLLSVAPSDRSYNSSAVSALSLETVTTASGSKTMYFYEGNSVSGGSNALFSQIGVGHRIKKIQTYDLSGGTEVLVRERTLTYYYPHITIPTNVFDRSSFVNVTEIFREDLVEGEGSWSSGGGTLLVMPRTCYVSFADQSVLPGVPLEEARILYGEVGERVTDPASGSGFLTEYYYDMSYYEHGHSYGQWYLTWDHDQHDDHHDAPGSHIYHFFQRSPWIIPRENFNSGYSLDFIPRWFHYEPEDFPQMAAPREVRLYKRPAGSGTDVLVSKTTHNYIPQRDTLHVGWRVRNMIAMGDEWHVKDTTCHQDFFVEKMYHNRVYRRLESTTQTEYLDDGTEKSVWTDYYYEPGARLSLTSVTAYPATVHTSPNSIPPVGSILSPRLTVQTVGVGVGENSPRQYARYSIFPDELSGLPGCAWADELLAAGYRSPIGEEVFVGGTVPSAPATMSGRYVTWASFIPADTGSGSLLKPSKIEVWRQEEGGNTNYVNVGPTVQYFKYDHWGNPLEIRRYDPQESQDQQTVTYLWSYGGLRPVAEIEGIGYAQTRSMVGPANVDAIASASNGPSNAQLVQIKTGAGNNPTLWTLYTYNLPFGISSAEDPSGRKTSYEYDDAGRLKGVRDDDGNLMEGHLYELTRGGSSNPNRITSLTYTAAGATSVPTSFSAAMNASNAIKEVNYLDGLGRTVQGVSVGAATNGKDLVTPFVPDFLDREDAKVYLPYPATTSTSNAGSYRSGALSAQQSYFTGLYGSIEGARAYSENVYELSARGRVTATSLPGFTDQTVLTTAGSPGGYLPVLTFDPVTQTLSASGYYPQNYFTVSVTAGPDGSLTETWTDEFGTPVLERVRIQEAAYLNEEDDWAETRYVKDVRGRVLCVIPPAEYDQLLTAANNNGIVSSFSAEHCYTYKYDGRDRVVKRHLPDKAMETLSYNNADLVTLTVRTAADGIGTETFTTIYDDHNRPTKETYQYGNATAITLARYAYDSKRDTLKVGGIVHSVPKFSEVAGIVTAADRDSLTLRGQKTAELVRIVSPGETPATMATNANAQFIVRSFHYDKKDNVIQTVEKRPDVNATVRTSTKYGFAGNVLQSKETVDIPASGNGSAITGNLNKAFTYDALLRPTGETSQLTSGGTTGPEGILNYTYDDFGRPSTLTRGSGTTDATTYSYTLQGWLQNASSPNYEETLRYASPSRTATDALPGKAGLVTEWTFRQKGTTANGAMSSSNTYAYTYDGAGRLLGSVRYSGSSTSKLSTLTEKNISYDHSGNLLALKRYGSSSGTTPVNNYTFTYTGTKRSGYTYDAHGNVTADPTNGTSIQWNVLGLPKSISDGTDSARRVYATDVTLLAVYEGTAGTTGKVYLGPMVYDRNATGTLSLESAGWEGGRILSGTGNDKLIYQITDHLGSVRVIKDGEGTVLQRFDYYPFGSESRVWTAGTNTPQSALRYRFGGKEIAGKKVSVSTGAPAAAAGSPYLDFGARVYDPRTAAWLAPDPLSEKYYGISPYSYAGDCPISIIDPNGRDIYLFGDLIEEAFKQLQDGMQGRISLSMDDSGKLSYSLIDGQKLKGNAKRMAKMIDDHSITVNLFTTDKDKTSTGNLMVGGAFMGNTVRDDGNGRRTVEARQEINPNVLGSADAHTRTPGKMIMHEVTEAYAGAEISMRSGKNAVPASGADEYNPQSVYMRAHKKATPQTIVGQHLYDSKGNLLENSVSNLPRASRVEWYVTHRGRELILQRLP